MFRVYVVLWFVVGPCGCVVVFCGVSGCVASGVVPDSCFFCVVLCFVTVCWVAMVRFSSVSVCEVFH